MELRHLRYFVAVAELGSISRAAQKLFIAQPPLSLQIKQLEEEVGAPLLIRYPRGVRLSPAGETFLAEAKDILLRADRAIRLAKQTGNAAGGVVRIGYVPTAGHTILPRLILLLRERRPECDIEVSEMTTAQQVQALRYHEIDVGLVRPPIEAGPVVAAAKLSDPFCLAIPKDHPLVGAASLDLKAAAQCVFVSVTRQRGPAYFDQTVGLCTDIGFDPNIRYESSTLYGVLELVGAGLGVALVPSSAVTLASDRLIFRVLKKPSRVGSLVLAQLKDDPNPLVGLLTELTEQVFNSLRDDLERLVVGLRQEK
ncbi:MAG: transcriptional regulator, LysR family [Proteobacteria bacterium]|nr:transcriptional regulator, LysR family [Pseudomonadota bacterium]